MRVYAFNADHTAFHEPTCVSAGEPTSRLHAAWSSRCSETVEAAPPGRRAAMCMSKRTATGVHGGGGSARAGSSQGSAARNGVGGSA
jgi:hypothetical protein